MPPLVTMVPSLVLMATASVLLFARGTAIGARGGADGVHPGGLDASLSGRTCQQLMPCLVPFFAGRYRHPRWGFLPSCQAARVAGRLTAERSRGYNSSQSGVTPGAITSRPIAPLPVACLADLPVIDAGWCHSRCLDLPTCRRVTMMSLSVRPVARPPVPMAPLLVARLADLPGPRLGIDGAGSHQLDALNPPAPAPSCATGRESGWRSPAAGGACPDCSA